MKPFKTLLEISLLILIGFSIFAFWNIDNALALGNCNEGFRVNAGQTKEINCHGVCKKVTNTGSEAKFVPTRSSNEWHQFRLYAPHISLEGCAYCGDGTVDPGEECDPPGDTTSCSCSYNYCSGSNCVTGTKSGNRTCQSDCTWGSCSVSCSDSCTYDSDCGGGGNGGGSNLVVISGHCQYTCNQWCEWHGYVRWGCSNWSGCNCDCTNGRTAYIGDTSTGWGICRWYGAGCVSGSCTCRCRTSW